MYPLGIYCRKRQQTHEELIIDADKDIQGHKSALYILRI